MKLPFSLLSYKFLIAGVLIAFTAGFSSGYVVKRRFALAEKAIAIEYAIKKIQHSQEVSDETSKKHIERIQEIQYRDKIVIKEIPIYVSNNNSKCNLTRGGVGLLNTAANQHVSEAAELSAEEKRKTSTIDQRTLVEACAEWAIRYEELKAKHDALVDWFLKTQ